MADLPQVAAWRRVFSEFGAKPTRYRNAAEALLRRLSKYGDIPTISVLVDIGNHVSIRYAMPVAVFDLANIAGPTTVRFATGDELFADLGSSDTVHPNPGEVVFVDGGRRECPTLVLAPERRKRHQHDHGLCAHRRRRPPRHRRSRRRSGASRPRLAARLVSAPKPNRVVDGVADQPLHRNERWRREARKGESMNFVEYVPGPNEYSR